MPDTLVLFPWAQDRLRKGLWLSKPINFSRRLCESKSVRRWYCWRCLEQRAVFGRVQVQKALGLRMGPVYLFHKSPRSEITVDSFSFEPISARAPGLKGHQCARLFVLVCVCVFSLGSNLFEIDWAQIPKRKTQQAFRKPIKYPCDSPLQLHPVPHRPCLWMFLT